MTKNNNIIWFIVGIAVLIFLFNSKQTVVYQGQNPIVLSNAILWENIDTPARDFAEGSPNAIFLFDNPIIFSLDNLMEYNFNSEYYYLKNNYKDKCNQVYLNPEEGSSLLYYACYMANEQYITSTSTFNNWINSPEDYFGPIDFTKIDTINDAKIEYSEIPELLKYLSQLYNQICPKIASNNQYFSNYCDLNPTIKEIEINGKKVYQIDYNKEVAKEFTFYVENLYYYPLGDDAVFVVGDTAIQAATKELKYQSEFAQYYFLFNNYKNGGYSASNSEDINKAIQGLIKQKKSSFFNTCLYDSDKTDSKCTITYGIGLIIAAFFVLFIILIKK